MTTALVILGVLAALFLAAALATRDSQALAPAPPDAADVVLPERVGADDIRQLRFGLAARGYRMSEVDAALDRLAAELEDRDRRIAELSGEPTKSEDGTGEGADVTDGVVEVDGITTAGLGAAGTGMDPLLPSVPAPDHAGGSAAPATPAPAADPTADSAALAAGAAGAAAVDVPALHEASGVPADPDMPAAPDVPAAPHGDDAFAGASDTGAPVEPVDPPARSA